MHSVKLAACMQMNSGREKGDETDKKQREREKT